MTWARLHGYAARHLHTAALAETINLACTSGRFHRPSSTVRTLGHSPVPHTKPFGPEWCSMTRPPRQSYLAPATIPRPSQPGPTSLIVLALIHATMTFEAPLTMFVAVE